jgi:hypothetical protein
MVVGGGQNDNSTKKNTIKLAFTKQRKGGITI